MSILGNLSPQEFLDNYWQQKPLLIRQAVPNISTPFDPEELAGLACQTDSARIIEEKGDTPWQLTSGPFEDDDFLSLPDSHWTLLVNDLEYYYPELYSLIKHFNFIPDWRVDDLMVSYAPDQGSVGPHVDEYDVFLLQAMGKRQWQIDSKADLENIISDIDLCLLRSFNAEEEWLLEPGDMLYLPPHLAHYGIAQGECMTYSIGFRAPSKRDLVESYLGILSDQTSLTSRFTDPKRTLQKHPAEISQQDISALKKMLFEALQQDDDLLTDWIGQYTTEAKHSIDTEREVLYKSGINYNRNSSARMVWLKKDNAIHLYHSGVCTVCSAELAEAIYYLTEQQEYTAKALKKWVKNTEFLILFNELLEDGSIRVGRL